MIASSAIGATIIICSLVILVRLPISQKVMSGSLYSASARYLVSEIKAPNIEPVIIPESKSTSVWLCNLLILRLKAKAMKGAA